MVQCSICLELIDNNDIFVLSCMHCFHESCVILLVKYANFEIPCPLCRTPQSIRYLLNFVKQKLKNIQNNIHDIEIHIKKHRTNLYFKHFLRWFCKTKNQDTFWTKLNEISEMEKTLVNLQHELDDLQHIKNNLLFRLVYK